MISGLLINVGKTNDHIDSFEIYVDTWHGQSGHPFKKENGNHSKIDEQPFAKAVLRKSIHHYTKLDQEFRPCSVIQDHTRVRTTN